MRAVGVYYTPTHVVDYIIEQTIAPLLLGRTPQDPPLKILEPACGQGVFLVRAYQYLLQWHRAFYLQHPYPSTDAALPLVQTVEGSWELSLTERWRILFDSIYGVELDPSAVAATLQALLAALLPTESRLDHPLPVLSECKRASWLQQLGERIKCGNAIIGLDLPGSTDSLQPSTTATGFDWVAEFPQIMAAGGFDVVLGNPPYVDAEQMSQSLPQWRAYCATRYQTAKGNWDLFCIFVEQALALCKPQGLTSLIVPNKLATAAYAAPARQLLAETNSLLSVRDYSRVPVFPVSVYPIVYVARKGQQRPERVRSEQMQVGQNGEITCALVQELDYQRFCQRTKGWPIGSTGQTLQQSHWLERLAQLPTLDTIAQVVGAATVAEAYALQSLIEEQPIQAEPIPEQPAVPRAYLPIVNSGTIDRYTFLWGQKPLRYLGKSYLHPVISPEQQFHLPAKRYAQSQRPKIIIAGLSRQLECAVDLVGGVLAAKSTVVLFSNLNLLFLLGLLNSQLLSFYYQTHFGGDRLQGGYLRIGPPQIRTLPLPPLDYHQPQTAAVQALIQSVEQRLALASWQQPVPRRPPNPEQASAVSLLEQAIDTQVYRLYQLSPEEIAAVAAEARYASS